jgi:hypothetical protein
MEELIGMNPVILHGDITTIESQLQST